MSFPLQHQVAFRFYQKIHHTGPALEGVLPRRNADLVHSHDYPSYSSRSRAVNSAGKPVVMTRPCSVRPESPVGKVQTWRDQDEPGERRARWIVEIILLPVRSVYASNLVGQTLDEVVDQTVLLLITILMVS